MALTPGLAPRRIRRAGRREFIRGGLAAASRRLGARESNTPGHGSTPD